MDALTYARIITLTALAMIAFAGRPYTVCPLTLDHDWLASHLDRVRVGQHQHARVAARGSGGPDRHDEVLQDERTEGVAQDHEVVAPLPHARQPLELVQEDDGQDTAGARAAHAGLKSG